MGDGGRHPGAPSGLAMDVSASRTSAVCAAAVGAAPLGGVSVVAGCAGVELVPVHAASSRVTPALRTDLAVMPLRCHAAGTHRGSHLSPSLRRRHRRQRRTVNVMRRLLLTGATLYLATALAARAAEAAGLTRCGCSSQCWCRKPVLKTFRWVAPVGHR